MAYPRRCPLCEADYRRPLTGYRAAGVACDDGHATLSTRPGGTPSPWRPTLPGRLLALRCLACDGEYAWDYFAGQPAGGAALAARRPQRVARPRRRPVVRAG